MKLLIALALIFGGIITGLYFGLWWAFIGGIIAVIEQVRAPHIDALVMALGIARIIFSGFIGTIVGYAMILPGVALLKNA